MIHFLPLKEAGLYITSWGEQIPEERGCCRSWTCEQKLKGGSQEIGLKVHVSHRRNGQNPMKEFQSVHKCTHERSSLLVPGTPGTQCRLIPDPCCHLCSFYLSSFLPHPTQKAGAAALVLEIEEWEDQEKRWNNMPVFLAHSGSCATNQAWARRNKQALDCI